MEQNKRLMSKNLKDYFLKKYEICTWWKQVKKNQEYSNYSPTAWICKKCP